MLIAHLSDPHLGPIPRPRLVELAGKRATGYVNWLRHRRIVHDMAIFAAVLADIAQMRPDHVALTGDLVNIGLPAEFPAARAALHGLGPPEHVTIVPGNHDIYVGSSRRAMDESFAPYMRGDTGEGATRFPFLRRRDGVALIGVSSAVPTAPFMATGRVGGAQRAALAQMLRETAAAGLIRVVLIHHPPHPGGARFGRGLSDARAFAAVLAAEGAELVLHGHNHRASLAHLPGPRGPVPIVGVASASAVPGTPGHRASWNLIRIEAGAAAASIRIEQREILGAGPQRRVECHRLLG